MQKSGFILFCLLVISYSAQARLTWFLSDEESSHKWAIVPSYKRTTSFGHVLGGRIFIYPTDSKGLYLASSVSWKLNQNNFIAYTGKGFYWTPDGSEFELGFENDFKFDSFYKENQVDRMNVPSENFNIKGQYLMKTKYNEHLLVGGFIEFRNREELKSPCFLIQEKEGKTHTISFKSGCYGFSKKEDVFSAGLSLRYDTRNSKFDPLQGQLIQGTLRLGFDQSQKGPLFLQMESSYRQIWSILDEERWILNLSFGLSLFNPTIAHPSLPYVHLFKLGGIDKLRGYHAGRFYNDHYYLAQGEFRWPWTKWLQVSLFGDIGSVHLLSTPLMSVGVGALLGLPPSYEQKLRLELGIGKDQQNFVIAFALPY